MSARWTSSGHTGRRGMVPRRRGRDHDDHPMLVLGVRPCSSAHRPAVPVPVFFDAVLSATGTCGGSSPGRWSTPRTDLGVSTLAFFWFVGHMVEDELAQALLVMILAMIPRPSPPPGQPVHLHRRDRRFCQPHLPSGWVPVASAPVVLTAGPSLVLRGPHRGHHGRRSWASRAQLVGFRAWGALLLFSPPSYGAGGPAMIGSSEPSVRAPRRGRRGSPTRGSRPGRRGGRRRQGQGGTVTQGPWSSPAGHPAGPSRLEQAELDVLLDKIGQSGIDSLSKEERRRLDELSRKIARHLRAAPSVAPPATRPRTRGCRPGTARRRRPCPASVVHCDPLGGDGIRSISWAKAHDTVTSGPVAARFSGDSLKPIISSRGTTPFSWPTQYADPGRRGRGPGTFRYTRSTNATSSSWPYRLRNSGASTKLDAMRSRAPVRPTAPTQYRRPPASGCGPKVARRRGGRPRAPAPREPPRRRGGRPARRRPSPARGCSPRRRRLRTRRARREQPPPEPARGVAGRPERRRPPVGDGDGRRRSRPPSRPAPSPSAAQPTATRSYAAPSSSTWWPGTHVGVVHPPGCGRSRRSRPSVSQVGTAVPPGASSRVVGERAAAGHLEGPAPDTWSSRCPRGAGPRRPGPGLVVQAEQLALARTVDGDRAGRIRVAPAAGGAPMATEGGPTRAATAMVPPSGGRRNGDPIRPPATVSAHRRGHRRGERRVRPPLSGGRARCPPGRRG